MICSSLTSLTSLRPLRTLRFKDFDRKVRKDKVGGKKPSDLCRQDSKFPVELLFVQDHSNHDITLERHSYLDRPSQRALVRVAEFSFPAIEM
jgi:hypothetical protein